MSDHAEADDLAAEVFVKAIAAGQRGHGSTSHIKGWLFRIAHNLVIDHYRTRNRQAPICTLEDVAETDDGAPTLQRHVERDDDNAAINHAIGRLTAEQGAVILGRLQGCGFDEIAAAMDKTEGAVKALNLRGLLSLRKLLGREPA